MILNHLPGIMAEKGVSIRRLSQLTNVTYTTIRAIYHSERRSVQLDVLGAICKALDIQPGDIYTSVEQTAVNPDNSPQVTQAAEIISPGRSPLEAGPPANAPVNDWKNW